jgi:multidrug resistance efflux pump
VSADPSLSTFPPIPTPPNQRWRAFRIELLPPLAFALCVGLIALLWRGTAVAPALTAEAEVAQAELRSAHGGTVLELDAEPMREVRAGEVLGRVRLESPAVVAGELGALRAELDSLRVGREPVIAGRRLALDAERLRLEWMRERTALAALRVELLQAEADLARQVSLRARAVTTEEAFDTARLLRERLSTQVAEQERLVATLEPASATESGAPAPDEALAAALHAAEAELRWAEARLAPEALIAPMDGVVTRVFRRAGEAVVPGEPLLEIVAPKPTRLVGWLRQPLALEPRPGMTVELRSRRPDRRSAAAEVLAVGRVLEPVPATQLALIDRADTPELGLRVYFSLPEGLTLRAGEFVDVMLDPADEPAVLR